MFLLGANCLLERWNKSDTYSKAGHLAGQAVSMLSLDIKRFCNKKEVTVIVYDKGAPDLPFTRYFSIFCGMGFSGSSGLEGCGPALNTRVLKACNLGTARPGLTPVCWAEAMPLGSIPTLSHIVLEEVHIPHIPQGDCIRKDTWALQFTLQDL